jgi:lysozyme
MTSPTDSERARRRRGHRLALTAGVLAAISVAAAWGWFAWLPQHRPGLAANERYGIDVSHHQGPITWNRVANDGISFAYIKATEGGDFVDDRFAANWDGAAGAGLERGAYHFFTFCTPGVVQAEHFLEVVPDDPALPPAVDLEIAGNCDARPSVENVDREVRAFLARVEASTGQQMVLYIGDDFESAYGLRTALDRPLWLPRFLLRPDDGWWIWQASSFARVEGVGGRVDLDVMRT